MDIEMFLTFPTMLLVTVSLLTPDCSSGVEGDLFFSAYNKHEKSTAGVIMTGEDLKLICSTDRTASLEIRLHKDGKQLVTIQGRNSVEYIISGVTCEDIGSYKCTADGSHKIWNLGVYDCPPQPCEATDVNKTLYLPLYRKAELSLCVSAYPNILNEVKINNVAVRKKHLSEWRWDYNMTTLGEGFINEFLISVWRDNITDEDNGTLNIRVYGNTFNLYLDYTIILKPPGPPECPTNVKVKNQGLDYVTLSWTPGLDGGANQSFHVYRSPDNVTWVQQDAQTGETSINITDLQPNMGYFFRVVASNKFSSVVNEFVCENTIHFKTKPTESPPIEKTAKDDHTQKSTDGPKNDDPGTAIIYVSAAACTVIVILSVLVVVLLCCMKVRLTTQNGYSIAGNEAGEELQEMAGVNTSSDHQTSGEAPYYISEEGLKYISVVHVPGKNRAKRKRKKEKQEKIVYATLDYTKTGNIRLYQDGQH